MLKKPSLLLLSCAMVLSLAACGPKRDAAPSGDSSSAVPTATQGAEAPKPEKLSIWANESEKEVQSIRYMTEKFTEKTGIKVEVIPFNAREQSKSFSLDGPAGRGPDLWWATHNSMGKNVLQGLAEPFKLSEEQLKSYSEDTIKAVTLDNNIYCLPMVVETAVLYYNKELLPKAPETWEELETFSSTYNNEAQKKYGFLIDGANFYYTNMFLQGNGGYIFKTNENGFDVDDVGLNNAGSVKGAELIQSWFQKGYLPKSITGDVMDGLFKEGKVGAVVSVPSSMVNYKQALGDKLAVAPIPKLANGQRPPSFLGIKGWVLSPFSKNKVWAEELARFMTSQESLQHHFEALGEIPATTGMLESDLVAKDPFFGPIAEQAKFATPTPHIPEISQTWEPMHNAFVFLSQGNNAQEVLNEAVDQIKEQIKVNNSSKK
ncbi:extracellular solute-binding protein [Gorillibacterium sp. sgz500922]|uniref:extracellular solute-binding protein n=1 Tax=Gorillibacterium sp. sgz500922 TaxID=3446694 RepID=UPI003F6655C8